MSKLRSYSIQIRDAAETYFGEEHRIYPHITSSETEFDVGSIVLRMGRGERRRCPDAVRSKGIAIALADAADGADRFSPIKKLICEHSGCGHGIQVEQVTVRLDRGDKVFVERAPNSLLRVRK